MKVIKKISVLLIFSFCAITSFAQTFPNNTTQANAATLTTFSGGVATALKIRQFADTTAANAVPYLRFTPHILIKCGDNIYVRNSAATAWLLQASSIPVVYYGVDSVTSPSAGNICIWSGGISNCFNVTGTVTPATGVDSVVINGNQLCYYVAATPTCYTITGAIINNTYISNLIDSIININNYYNFGNCVNRVISGSVTIDSLFAGRTTAITFQLASCSTYNVLATVFNITGSGIADRYTIVYADTLRNIGTIDGGTNPPDIPNIVDDESQILLAIYFIPAGSTTPQNVTNEWVYREGDDYWLNIRRTVTTGFDSAYTVNPFAGLLSLRIPSMVAGQYFEWHFGGLKTAANYDFFTAHLRKSGTIAKGTKWSLTFYNGNSVATANAAVITDGSFGYNRNVSGSYESIAIPFSVWNFINPLFDRIRVMFIGNTSVSTQWDDVKLQAGGGNTNGGQTVNGVGGQNIVLKIGDKLRLSADSTNYELVDSFSNTVIAIAPTFLSYLLTSDTCIVIDTTGRYLTKTSYVSLNPYCRGSGGSASDSLFGIQDNVGRQNRENNMNQYYLDIYGTSWSEIEARDAGDTRSSRIGTGMLADLGYDDLSYAQMYARSNLDSQKVTLNVLSNNVEIRHDYFSPNGGTPVSTLKTTKVPVVDGWLVASVNGVQPSDSSGNVTISGGGSGISQVVAGSGLQNDNDSTVRLADSVRTGVYSGLASKLNLSDTSAMLAGYQTAIDSKLTNITGLVTQGTNVTITGSGTSGSPYVVNSSGGGGSTDTTSLSNRINAKQDSLNWYIPEHYGAVGNGSTDDAAAFTAMIGAMPPKGGYVRVIKTYQINSTVTVNKQVHFVGNGGEDFSMGATALNSAFKAGADNIVMFKVTEDNVSFKDLTFFSTFTTPTSGTAIRLDTSVRFGICTHGANIERCGFDGFFNNIEATNAFQFSLINSRFRYYNYGVKVSNVSVPDAGDSYITGCTFEPKGNGTAASIYQTNSGGLKVVNNKFNKNNTFKTNYSYLAEITGTSDLLITGNSFENYRVSAIKLLATSAGAFSNVTITGNQFSAITSGSKPDIVIDSTVLVSIQGNVFYKSVGGSDTAIALTSVTATTVNNAYTGYGVPVYYYGTNVNKIGDGAGVKYSVPSYATNGVVTPTTTLKDSLGIISTLPPNMATYPTNYTNSGAGAAQLSIGANLGGLGLDISMINSNLQGGGFTFSQQTAANAGTSLLRLKGDGSVGIGVNNPLAKLNVLSTTEQIRASYDASNYGSITTSSAGVMLLGSSANYVRINRLGIGLSTPTAGLHLIGGTGIAGGVPFKISSGSNVGTPEDGGMEYNGTHLYFSIGSTRYQLDQQPQTPPSIGSTLTSATTGSVLFAGGSATFAQDNTNFFWDDTNNRLGLGTTGPADALEVKTATNAFIGINTASASGSTAIRYYRANTRRWQVGLDLNANGTNDYYIYDATNSKAKIYADASGNVYLGGTASATSTAVIGILDAGRVSIGNVTATAKLHLAAGTATASTAPLKFTSGTNLTTAETGAIEYNGTNLFFTRTGTTRESVMTANAVNSVSPTSPNRTITVIIDGTTYYIAAKTTND